MIKDMLKSKLLIKFWLPVLIWAGVIFTFSSLPTVETTKFYFWDFIFKKSAHFIEYVILATLLYRGLINSKINSKKAMWLSVLVAFLYAVSDEYHQSFVSGRGPAVRDVVIDVFGAAFALFSIIENIKIMPKVIQELYIKYQIIK